MSWCSSVRVFCALFIAGALTITSASVSYSAQATRSPTPEEQAELEKYPAYSGSLNVLEPNGSNGIHSFLEDNNSKTVYLDLSIVRYLPADPSALDRPDVRAATDRFENPVFSKCWPDQRAEHVGIINFGEEGYPLPLDEADIQAGCAIRVRFEHQMIESVSAFDKLWGDNKVQVFLKGFFSIHKSTLANGKTLYTIREEAGVPLETRAAFEAHKTTKHAEAQLSLEAQE